MSADAGKEKKERREGKGRDGGKGGEGREGGKSGKGEGGKGGRPRKPREELPMVEDPAGDLDKLLAQPEPKKPSREALDAAIAKLQADIDAKKARTEQITKDLDAIKAKNERLKKSGASGMEACREKLREFKKQIVGVIEERKRISASIDEIRAKKNESDEAIKKQRAAIGRFSSNESIDEEIKRIEEHMAHNSLSVKQEKEFIVEIKALNKKRDEVKQLEVMEGKRGGGGSKLSLPDLFEARKKVDEKLNGLRDQEKAAVDELNTLRDKSSSKDSDRFPQLLEERKGIRESIAELINTIRDKRTAHSELDDKWYNHDRLVKNLKWQIRQKNIKEREERKKKWEEDHAGEPAEDEEDEEGEKKEKMIDWDLAERIMLCEQLIVFLENYIPKEEEKAQVSKEAVVEGGYTKDSQTGLEGMDDPLGLNAFMVDEVVSKQSKKKNKKKKHNAAKTDVQAALQEHGSVPLALSLEMMKNFGSMGLATPTNSDDAPDAIQALKTKKAYYEQEGEAGLTLKEVLKKEKSSRKGNKGGDKEEKKEEAPKAAAAEPAAPAEEKKGPDWHAEKIARKLAEAPKVDEDLVASLRAKAQSKAMTDEEKKARGLLYDTSKAKATRDDSSSDDDEDAAAFADGDPFDGL